MYTITVERVGKRRTHKVLSNDDMIKFMKSLDDLTTVIRITKG